MSAFMENLRKYEQKNKGAKSLSALNRDCLIVYYLINCLFYIDSSVWQETIIKGTSFEDEIEKYRKNISSKVLDAIFDVVRHIIRENGNIVIKCSGSRHGRVKYRKSNQHAVSGPLIYLLNQETKLREFVDKPHIELSPSAAERAIRLGACARHSFQFLNHPDSAQAFADHLTIANTCTMNNVSFTQYTLWLMANIRYRIVQKLMLEGMQSHAVSLPKSRTETIEDGDNKVKIRIWLYDKANKNIFDEISYEGLTPYDFKTLILSRGE
ncbi:IS66 family transposase [Anaerobiospirillum thomasii]|uniref:IS66 family transposase n=1 Tax=Anaerobiospirillum thomasii TaxID=179995 RepID=UPI000DE5AF4D|nr:transposase [Anaerobiospirillum thomasii]